MKIKLFGINIKIGFSFFALIIILMTAIKSEYYLTALICSLIHECGHIFACICYDEKISEIKISFYGVILKRENRISDYKKSIIISSAGPLFNLLFAFVLIILKIFNYDISYIPILTNIFLFIFNMLPVNSLDGGTILKYSLYKIFGITKGERIFIKTSFGFLSFCLIITVLFYMRYKTGIKIIILLLILIINSFLPLIKSR